MSLCPVGALVERSEWRQVLQELRSRRKVLVAQTAPAVRVAVGEEAGLDPGGLLLRACCWARAWFWIDWWARCLAGACCS